MWRFPLAVLLIAAAACGRRGALVTIRNESPDTLRSVVLSGKGFADTVAAVAPGELAALRVRPRGESGIGVAFSANERRISAPEEGYFESSGGYVVALTVDSSLVVGVQVTLEQY
jgi:hypothetical protein